LIADASVLVAAADPRAPAHAAARELLVQPGEKIVTDAILSEAHHLIAKRAGWGIAAAFLESVDTDLVVEVSTPLDRARARDLCRRYLDARLDYTDALTVAVAERVGERVIATLDERHFRMLRPSHVASFEIVPSG